MVDFSAIMKQTPEERQAERERTDRHFQEQNLLMISSRQAIIQECSKKMSQLSAWEIQFLESMTHKAEARDLISGLVGGELSYLSAKQLVTLSSMHARVSNSPTQEAGVVEPNRKTQYPSSRM